MWSCLTFEETATVSVIPPLSIHKCEISKRGDDLLICTGMFNACNSSFFAAVIKHFGQRNWKKDYLFVLAMPEGEETIMVGKYGRKQQTRQPKGSESFEL